MLEQTIGVEDLAAPVSPEGHPVRFDAGGPFMFPRIIRFKKASRHGALEIEQEQAEWTGTVLSDQAAGLLDAQLARAEVDLKMMGNSPHLLNNLGAIYLNKGEGEQARKCFAEAVALRPGFYEGQSNLAKAYLREKRVEDALQVYTELASQRPDDTRVLMNLAHAHLRLGDLGRSAECLDKVIRLDPGNARAFHNRGLLSMGQRRWGQAVRDVRRATRLDVRFAEAYNSLGVCYLLQGSLKKAEKALRGALALAPLNDNATVNLVLVLDRQDRHEEALTIVEEYVRREPANVGALFAQVALLIKLRHFEKGLKVLDKMDALMDQLPHQRTLKPWVRFNRGMLHQINGDEPSAEVAYRGAIELAGGLWDDPSPSVIFYACLSLLYMTHNRLPEARELLEICEKEWPDDALTLLLLSMLQSKLGDNEEALRLAEKGLALDPENAMLQYVRGDIYGKLGRHEEQVLCYRLALDLGPNHPMVLNGLAYAYLESGDTERAREVLDEAHIESPGPELTATRGLLLIKEGDVREGRRLYNEAAAMVSEPGLRNLIRQKKHLELGRRLLEQGDARRARRELRRVEGLTAVDGRFLSEAQDMLDSIRAAEQTEFPGDGDGGPRVDEALE